MIKRTLRVLTASEKPRTGSQRPYDRWYFKERRDRAAGRILVSRYFGPVTAGARGSSETGM